MQELLTKYSLAEIIIFIFLLLGAVKAFWELASYFYNKIRCFFDAQYKEEKNNENLQTRIDNCEKMILTWDEKMDNLMNNIDSLREDCQTSFVQQDERLQMLVDSDKDEIKGFIVREYHRFEEQGWIDDFSLDVLERRYEHYTAEGGNSFIRELMDDIRKLPHNKPED